jgi:hypothetical protein
MCAEMCWRRAFGVDEAERWADMDWEVDIWDREDAGGESEMEVELGSGGDIFLSKSVKNRETCCRWLRWSLGRYGRGRLSSRCLSRSAGREMACF